jgi:hypothetical protein
MVRPDMQAQIDLSCVLVAEDGSCDEPGTRILGVVGRDGGFTKQAGAVAVLNRSCRDDPAAAEWPTHSGQRQPGLGAQKRRQHPIGARADL